MINESPIHILDAASELIADNQVTPDVVLALLALSKMIKGWDANFNPNTIKTVAMEPVEVTERRINNIINTSTSPILAQQAEQIATNPALLNSLYRRTHNDMVALYKEAGVEIHNDR